MHIFVDESGTFAPGNRSDTSICTVGALVIPTRAMVDFHRLFGRLRVRLPTQEGEVKGRRLNQEQMGDVVGVLRKVSALFEVVAIDTADHSIAELEFHRCRQAEAILAHMTPEHHPNMVAELREHRAELERMPLQLYVQSAMMGVLIYNTIDLASTYFAFRSPKELASYHWVIDAKDRSRTTNWEKWRSISVLPALESKSFRKPFMEVEGGDYSAQERFSVDNLGDYKRQFIREPGRGAFYDLKAMMKEDFRFSADPEFGLEAVDILTNGVRRSMNGSFQRQSWINIPQLMIRFLERNAYFCHRPLVPPVSPNLQPWTPLGRKVSQAKGLDLRRRACANKAYNTTNTSPLRALGGPVPVQVKRKSSRMFSQRSIHGRIAHEIGQQILRGDLQPDEVLPNETDLGAGFGVSRTVLREAIKVLAAKGLVESRPKIGTRVKPRDQWNMLDPDVLSWSLVSHDAEDYALAVSEMRRVLEPAGAALAAQRATPEQRARIRAAYEAMDAAGKNAEDSIDHDLRFHLSILEATNNPFLVSMGHVIESAIAFNIRLSVEFPSLRVQSVPLHRLVLERIEKGDPRGAQAAMVKLLQEALVDIERILARPRGGRAARAASTRQLRRAHR